MSAKSQNELELPAKVYQVDAVERKVDEALGKLDVIARSVSGVVTETQMETRIKEVRTEIEKDFDVKIKSEIKAINLKYGPTYKGIWWVVASMATGLLAMFWAMLNNFWRGQ